MPPPDRRKEAALAALRRRMEDPRWYPIPLATDDDEVMLADEDLYGRLYGDLELPEGVESDRLLDTVMSEKGWRRSTEDDPEFKGSWTLPWDAYPPFAQDTISDPTIAEVAVRARAQYPDGDPGSSMPLGYAPVPTFAARLRGAPATPSEKPARPGTSPVKIWSKAAWEARDDWRPTPDDELARRAAAADAIVREADRPLPVAGEFLDPGTLRRAGTPGKILPSERPPAPARPR